MPYLAESTRVSVMLDSSLEHQESHGLRQR